MKSFIRVSLLVGCIVLANAGQGFAACGLGTTIWEGSDSFAAKVVAFTTNVWTFKGISTTSEISGCTESDNIFKSASTDAKVRHYASLNFDHLSADMARGAGEHLGGFAHVIQLEKRDFAAFRQLTHENFEELFPDDYTTSGEMLEVLSRLMAEHEALAAYLKS